MAMSIYGNILLLCMKIRRNHDSAEFYSQTWHVLSFAHCLRADCSHKAAEIEKILDRQAQPKKLTGGPLAGI